MLIYLEKNSLYIIIGLSNDNNIIVIKKFYLYSLKAEALVLIKASR